ncbi:MAG: hypothetical protein D6732_01635 [Methanobacteriota archaeon]|nr:MAG: hypothetical protein D6732_01635 [Euryarchaeota archaeon]
MFEMYGLIVRNYHPLPHENIIVGKPVTIGAHVAMMCGCPTRPGFIWNSDKFTIKAIVEKNGKVIADLPLNYAGSLSNFEANYTFNDVGVYKITTIAIDDKNNQGIDVTSFSVRTAKKFNKLSGIKSK